MNQIIIARHGNTFDTGDKVVRVGCKTDLPLSSSGTHQAMHIGKFLKTNRIKVHAVFTSNLSRTIETANIALEEAGIDVPVEQREIFNEIDYGPDEGKTDEEVIARVGERALQDWNSLAVVPPGWLVDPEKIVEDWKNFAAEMLEKYTDQTVMVVTSNGIARFAPYLSHNFLEFTKEHSIKLATGALAAMSYKDDSWHIDYWNEQPR